ncbi:MAG TPA: LysR family transcriptional regulator [Methylomirabilota bacterium]|nr:LysR family transcriptional regulator [Methylomirabilota bacterium]
MLDRLTLDQLRVLVAVADSGSFSAAARRLGRVQSAISQSAQSLEAALGIAVFDRTGKTPTLTEAGRVMLDGARHLVGGAELLRARAESIAADVEPHLTLAIDAFFPNAVLMPSLKALSEAFPCLPVTLFTDGLGAPEQRLRDGVARLGIYAPLATGARGLETEFLASIPLVPVVATGHPLAAEPAPIAREVLEQHVQLVLTDRSPLSAGMSGGIVSVRIWRFVDLSSRLDFLLAGFGWGSMPLHTVEEHIAAGRLKRLDLKESGGRPVEIPLHVVHERGRPPGRAGRWLIDDLRRRLPAGDSAVTSGPATGAPR